MPRITVVFATLIAAAGCAELLGGLDEGGARDGTVDGSIEEPDASSSPCRALAGYRYRIPLRVEHRGPAILGYQVKLAFSSQILVATGKLEADGRDIAVTLADGVTRIPHWVEGGLGTPNTTLWMRVDLGQAPFDAWLYFGNTEAVDRGSMADTFVTGLIANPLFERTDSWVIFQDRMGPSTSSNRWSILFGDGGAELFAGTSPEPNGRRMGLCQGLTPPQGLFRLAFDLDLRLYRNVTLEVRVRPSDEPPVWAAGMDDLVAPTRAWSLETPPFQDASVLCLAATIPAGPGASDLWAIFSRLRARRWLESDPTAAVAGAEEATCAP